MMKTNSIEYQIKELESQKTGNFFNDVDIDQKIRHLQKPETEVPETDHCNLDDDECIGCGS